MHAAKLTERDRRDKKSPLLLGGDFKYIVS